MTAQKLPSGFYYLVVNTGSQGLVNKTYKITPAV